MHAAGDDVAALHQPQGRRVVQAHHAAGNIFRPRPGGVDQPVGGDAAAIGEAELPQAIHAFGPRHRRARQHGCPARGGILQVFDHQPGIVHPAIPVAEGGAIARIKRAAGAFAAQIDARRARHHLAPGEMIIKEGAQPQHPHRAHAFGMGQHERLRPGDVRRDIEQHFAFGQRLSHQAKGIIFKIAQAAVDQLGGG